MINHADIAWNNTLKQHYDAANMETLYRAFHAPHNSIQRTLIDLEVKTTLENSTGRQLDNLASIVGVSREIPEAVFLPFFGYDEQNNARGYGKARYRKIGEQSANAYLLPDAELRALIKAKIIVNNSHGTYEDIIEFAKTVYRVSRVRVRATAPNVLEVQIGKITDENDIAAKYFEQYVPVAATVSVNFVYSEDFS